MLRERVRIKNMSVKSLREGNSRILVVNFYSFLNLRDLLSTEVRLRTLSRDTRCSNGSEIGSNITREYVMVRREASRKARVVYRLWWSLVYEPSLFIDKLKIPTPTLTSSSHFVIDI